MSLGRPSRTDTNIVSTAEDLNKIDQSYREYSHQRVSVQQGNPQTWSGGSNLVFELPQYSDSVWDLRDAYLDAKVRFQVKFTPATTGTEVLSPLPAHNTCAPEEFFLSSLVEDIEVTYGGTVVNGVSAPGNAYPVGHAAYTLMTEDAAHHHGSAINKNFLIIADDDQARLIDQTRVTDVCADSKNPYNMTLSYDKLADEKFFSSAYPFTWQASAVTFALNPSIRYSSTQQYLQQLISNGSNYKPAGGSLPATVLAPEYIKPYVVNCVMKLKVPMFDNNHKYPANLPLRVTLRRSRSPYLSLTGFAEADAWLVTGTGVGAGLGDPYNSNTFSAAAYDIKFEALDLYVKRLVMSDSQREVLYSVPSLQYDLMNWQVQLHNPTGLSINHNLNFQSRPTLVMVGLVPNNSFEIPTITKFDKTNSIFHTSSRDKIGFSRLYINSNLGKIPENDYRPIGSDGQLDPQQEGRAYQQFKKACRNQMAVVPYFAWANNYNWYCFIVNSDDSNPQYTAEDVDRTTINITAELNEVVPNERNNHKLVVIGVSQNVLSVTNFSSVVVNV